MTKTTKKTTKHTATHDGQTFTRSSKTRRYTHAIIGRKWARYETKVVAQATAFANRKLQCVPDTTAGLRGWECLGWASSRELAEKRAKTERAGNYYPEIMILEATTA